jgi:hypothetical protein
MPQLQKSKTATSRASKIDKTLLELDHTTNATTNTQKAIKYWSQKFQQPCSFQTFQEFYGSEKISKN